MKKDDLLKQIADTAYNVGFGAKKHFATYDIVEKAPGWIGFISLGIGIFALFIDVLASKHMSAILIVIGISGLLINLYNDTKQSYEQKGILLTKLFEELKSLYFEVKATEKSDFSDDVGKLADIKERYYSSCISKQILFSDWYAHYKFFWQQQIDWVNEQKHFKFWRDKMPLSLAFFVAVIIMSAVFCLLYFARSKGLL